MAIYRAHEENGEAWVYHGTYRFKRCSNYREAVKEALDLNEQSVIENYCREIKNSG